MQKTYALIQIYKVLSDHDHIKWKREPEKNVQGDNDGPASKNLRRVTCFRKEPANICSSKNEFFLNRVITLWNDLPQKIQKLNEISHLQQSLLLLLIIIVLNHFYKHDLTMVLVKHLYFLENRLV